jgi:hypothetical protein
MNEMPLPAYERQVMTVKIFPLKGMKVPELNYMRRYLFSWSTSLHDYDTFNHLPLPLNF